MQKKNTHKIAFLNGFNSFPQSLEMKKLSNIKKLEQDSI